MHHVWGQSVKLFYNSRDTHCLFHCWTPRSILPVPTAMYLIQYTNKKINKIVTFLLNFISHFYVLYHVKIIYLRGTFLLVVSGWLRKKYRSPLITRSCMLFSLYLKSFPEKQTHTCLEIQH